MRAIEPPAEVLVEPDRLPALLGVPEAPRGLVIFAHGSGSGRLSPRNTYVAERLRRAGIATLLLDLLTPEEEADRRNVFDIPLLASRLAAAADWTALVRPVRDLPLGYFGASTGAGAALLAASKAGERLRAVVSRGGRPDLAGAAALARVRAATLLIVGSRDLPVIELNQVAARHLVCPHELIIVPGAHHLFEEPGTLDAVVDHATRWFLHHFEEATDVRPAA
ncbi:dienelactone hydrolase family protein [Hephaestia mangrovi]|uniref:dienelactone hydrolase family protein n=1 Tax=Hephaestia mangrovi TaxID=2873268 RepID=UPI001CA6ED74|nr:alpha/beta family hydrolase [Hephaestia mangrovi]MBY8827398.1 alpha/beta hydrolase [Hephaestia mangrovi]